MSVSYTHLDVYKRQAQQTAAAAQALHAGTIQQQLITGEAGTDQQEPEQKKSWCWIVPACRAWEMCIRDRSGSLARAARTGYNNSKNRD